MKGATYFVAVELASPFQTRGAFGSQSPIVSVDVAGFIQRNALPYKPLAAGVAHRPITPPPNWIAAGRIWLWGMGTRHNPCSGVLNDLEVRALAFRDHTGTAVILITADLGALAADTTQRVRDRLADLHGISGEYVCINVSHTHNAPVFVSIPTWQEGVATADAEYVAIVENAMVDTSLEALRTLRPAQVEFGRGWTTVAANRHGALPSLNVMETALDVLRVTGLDGMSIATVVIAACHPVCDADDNQISSDFVGRARSLIEAQAGGMAIFVQGYAGVYNPRLDSENTGVTLAADVAAVLQGDMDALDGALDAWLATVDLPLRPIADGAIERAKTYAADGDGHIHRWGDWMDAQGQAIPAVLPTQIQVLRVGSGASAWYLAASSHEPVADLGTQVKALWPYERVSTVGYSNIQRSYIPSRLVLATPPCTDFPLCSNNYEGGDAFVWYGHRGPLMPESEDLFLGTHIALLDYGWEHIGHATSVVGMAAWNDRLYAVTSNGKLWWRTSVPEDVPWHSMGRATDVVGLAVCNGELYCATEEGQLWQRSRYGYDTGWTAIGHATAVVAMTATDGRLFAATSNDRLWRREPVLADIPWEEMGHATIVSGLAATRGKLFATTTDGHLHWREPSGDDLPWHRFGDAPDVVGMAAIGDLLYVATRDGRLLRRLV